MAQSANFFGLRRGSTKSLTFATYEGKQITKDRVTNVKNPQTLKQMQQRLKLPLVANFTSALNGIVNHSYEGVDYGNKSIRKCRQLNLQQGKLYVASYVYKGSMDCGVASFNVSQGSLPEVPATINVTDGSYYGKSEIIKANLYEGEAAPDTDSEITDEQQEYLKSLFTANYQDIDQLTFIVAIPSAESSLNIDDETLEYYYRHTFVIARLILDPDRNSENEPWKWGADGTLKTTYITLGYNAEDGLTVKPNVPGAASNSVEMFGIIASKKDDSIWRRSTCDLATHVSDYEVTFEKAEPTYLKNEASSDRYLNTGSDSVNVLGGN